MEKQPEEENLFIKYCMGIAEEFTAQLNRLRNFVKHNLTSGTANETILREFLSKHAPGEFNVGQGFICNPLLHDAASNQCDILIYNQNQYPLVYSEGSIKVVWPDAVKMVIEVKTNFGKKEIYTAIENIISARTLSRGVRGVIFAFRSANLKTIIKHLEEYPYHIPSKHLPTAILLFDKGVIIHSIGLLRADDDLDKNRPFRVYKSKNDQNHGSIVLTFLLLLLYDTLGGHGFLTSDIVNLNAKILKMYTTQFGDDIRIGQLSDTSEKKGH